MLWYVDPVRNWRMLSSNRGCICSGYSRNLIKKALVLCRDLNKGPITLEIQNPDFLHRISTVAESCFGAGSQVGGAGRVRGDRSGERHLDEPARSQE